jgi:lipopolysaccharide export system permease protein
MDDFFKNKKFQFSELFLFYLNHFLKRADFLLPLALGVATIKVLTTLNMRREWIVLQVAGIKTRRLFFPFFYVACGCFCFNILNFQFWLPAALNNMDDFHASHFKHSHRAKRKELIHILHLRDNSKLIYQNYDKDKNLLFDVIWVRTNDDIWRMKYLNANPQNPSAQYVDHLVRTKDGFLEKSESYSSYRFDNLRWRPQMTGKGLIPFENRSLKELFNLARNTQTTPYELPKIITQLCFKCAASFLSIFAVLAIAPWCVRFSRKFSPFMLYALALFGLMAFYMILDDAVVLGENNIVAPYLAIFIPFSLLGMISTSIYWKKTV